MYCIDEPLVTKFGLAKVSSDKLRVFRPLRTSSGNEAFLQSARIDLDKGYENTRKAVSGSGEAASLLIGSWRKPLRLTLETSIRKKLHSLS
jgi:hypothetical protein